MRRGARGATGEELECCTTAGSAARNSLVFQGPLGGSFDWKEGRNPDAVFPWGVQVQEAVKCRVVDRQEDGNADSGGSFQNGHAQLMVP